MSSGDGSAKKTDVLFVHSPTPKGDGYRVIRARESRIEVGEVSNVKEGEPLRGEVLKLSPRKESSRLFDVDVVVPRAETQPTSPHAGPPQVASEAYRQNWETVFGVPRKREYLN